MSAKTFVREATGFVREIGFLDHLITNMNGVVPLAAIVLTPWWVWYAVPGGDPLIASVGGVLFTLFGSLVSYSAISATFPRSAAPYVANSRILHPAIGWPAEVLMWLGWIMALALYPAFILTWGLIPGLYTMGVSSGNRALIDAAFALTDPVWAIPVGILILVSTTVIAILGTKRLVRTFQLPLTILMFISIAVMLAVWAGGSLTQLKAVLPTYLNRSYDAVLQEGASSFAEALVPVSLAFVPVMASIAFTAGSFNTYWNSWASGEVRRAGNVRMQILSMWPPSILIFALVAATLGISQALAGRNFLVSMTQILSLNPGYFEGVPTMAGFSTMTLIPMMLANNPAVQFIMMIGIVAAGLAYTPVNWLIVSRQWFAWSFDRLLPSRFADVSERFHTPVLSIVVNFVAALIFLVLFTFFMQYVGFFTTAAWDTTLVTIALLCLAAAVLPLRKGLWNLSPASKYKIGAVPVITIAGILGFIYNGSAVLFFSITPALGFGLPSTLLLIVTFLIPFVLYWVVRQVRKAQGIDTALIFKTIPPE